MQSLRPSASLSVKSDSKEQVPFIHQSNVQESKSSQSISQKHSVLPLSPLPVFPPVSPKIGGGDGEVPEDSEVQMYWSEQKNEKLQQSSLLLIFPWASQHVRGDWQFAPSNRQPRSLHCGIPGGQGITCPTSVSPEGSLNIGPRMTARLITINPPIKR